MQVATCSNNNHFARVDGSEQKRAPVKSNGKHLRQRRKVPYIEKGQRALVKPEGSTYAGARSAHHSTKKKSLKKVYKLVAGCKGFIWKPNLRKIRDARKTLKHFESRR